MTLQRPTPRTLRLAFAWVFTFGIVVGVALGLSVQMASVDPIVFAYGFAAGLFVHAVTGWMVRRSWRRR